MITAHSRLLFLFSSLFRRPMLLYAAAAANVNISTIVLLLFSQKAYTNQYNTSSAHRESESMQW